MTTLAEIAAELARRRGGAGVQESPSQMAQASPSEMARMELARRRDGPPTDALALMRQAGMTGQSATPTMAPNMLDPVQGDPTGAAAVVETVADNVVGLDNDRESFGENLANFANTAGESMTLGIVGDEASAGMDAMMGRGTYDESLAARREQESQYRGDNPYMAFAADVFGGIVAPGAAGAKFVAGAATNAGRLTRAAVAGATAGGIYGGMEGEGEDRLANAAGTAAAGAFFGAAIPVVASAAAKGINRLWSRAAERPSVGILKDVKNAAYRAVETANEVFGGDDMSALAARVQSIADNDVSYVPGEDTAVDAAIRSIVRREGQDTTISQLDTIRQGLWRRVTANPDQVQIYDLIGELDALVDTRAATSELMDAARLANRQYSQSDLLDRAFQRAQDQAESTGSGGNVANLYRQAITRIVNNPRQSKFFSEAQREVMRAFLRDSRSQRAMRMIGKMSPSGNGLMLMLQALGGMATSGATVPLAVAGAGAKNFADRAVMRGSEVLLDNAAGFVRPATAANPLLGGAGAALAPIAEDVQGRVRNALSPPQ